MTLVSTWKSAPVQVLHIISSEEYYEGAELHGRLESSSESI